MTPVVGFRLSPVRRAGETDQETIAPSLLDGVSAEMATPCVKVAGLLL